MTSQSIMDLMIESRLKNMRRLFRSKDSSSRRLSLSNWRREKRQQFVTEKYRKIDSEWYSLDTEDDNDLGINSCDDIKCLDVLFGYLSGQTLINDFTAKKVFVSVKSYLKNNTDLCKDLMTQQFFLTLSTFVSKPIISSQIRFAALDLIQDIVKYEQNDELMVKNKTILHILVNFNASDIEVVTKTVVLMQELTRYSSRLLVIAIDNGYLLFLMKIIESTQVFTQRKSTETIRSKRLSEKKFQLIREVSESLRLIANELTTTDVIKDLYSIFGKLLHFKDNKIIINALSSLKIIITRNPETIVLLNRNLMLSTTDLMSKNNQTISSIVVQFWKLFYEAIDYTVFESFKSLLIESNLIQKLYEILSKVDNKGLVSEVADFLYEFVDRFDNSFELLVPFDIYHSLIIALSGCNQLTQRQVLTTINRIVDRIESLEMVTHFLKIELLEALVPFLGSSDPGLMTVSSRTLYQLMKKAEEFGLRDVVLIRAEYCSLNVGSLCPQIN